MDELVIDEFIHTGTAALAEGRWEDARTVFEASLAEVETPEGLQGLGTALWWLGEARRSAHYRERAFVLLRKSDDNARACSVAIDLVITYLVNLGNAAAARGWLARAQRVGQELDPNPMQGWLLLMHGYLEPDPRKSLEFLERALQFAKEVADVDLELVALADLGVALVTEGKVEEGMMVLDEAMAATLAGESGRLETVVYNCCSMLSACHAAGDIERAAQWCQVADDFMRVYTCPFLFASCRIHFGSLLFTKGQWDRAERELRAGLRLAEEAGPGPKAEALARLGELRLRQGRLEEAEELLAESDQAGDAALPAAELQLAQGRPSTAVAILNRRLAEVAESVVQAAPALALLVVAHIACGNLAEAREANARLEALVEVQGGEQPAAYLDLASASVLTTLGHRHQAITRLEKAVERFSRLGLPFETARVRLDLARLLVAHRPELAGTEAKNAMRGFERIGATAYADEAASLLRSLGERVTTRAARDDVLTKREQEVLRLVGLGLSNPEIAARLFISRKTAAHHVSNVLMKLGMRNRAEVVAYATWTQERPE